MGTLHIKVFLLLTIIHVYRSESTTQSYVGKDFVFAIVPSFSAVFRFELSVYIDIGSKEKGNFTMDVPFLNINSHIYNLHDHGHLRISLDNSIIGFNTFKENRGIQIHSSVDISVLVTMVSSVTKIMKAFIVYPSHLLGTRYSVLSYGTATVNKDYNSYVVIVGVTNNTHIVVKKTTSKNNITLNPLEVYQFNTSAGADPTGISIFADKPITVLTGTALSYLVGYVQGSLLAAQMLPMKNWEDEFIIAEANPLKSLIARYASNSSVNVTAINRHTVTHLSTGGNNYALDSSFIRSSENIELMQYNGHFMTLVPGISQYMNEYSFVVPVVNVSHIIHSLSVIVNTFKKDGLLLDGSSFTGREELVEYSQYNFTMIRKNVSAGYHLITHKDPTVKFGLLAYGSNNNYDYSYGFYVGLKIKDTTTEIPSTSTTAQTVVSRPSQLFCYSCHDTDELGLCDVVRKCGQSQVCYVQRKHIGGINIYSSGCLEQHTCEAEMRNIDTGSDNCLHCCSGDFCNNKGCGDTGLPLPGLRGPECFECEHISTPDLCPTLTLCGHHQICSIEEYRWGDITQYKLGCSSKACLMTKRSLVIKDAYDIERRFSSPVRHACCSGDYCNHDVNVLDTAPNNTGSPALIG